MVVVAVLVVLATLQLARTFSASVATISAESNSMLVSTNWLGEHLSDRTLVILNIGPRAAFDKAHIPGARLVEMSSISTSQPLTLELPPVDKLKAAFEELGVSDNSRIVVSFSENWVTPATRVYFTLDYLGFGKQTSLLDGGFEAWQSEHRPVTTETSSIKRGSFTPHPQQLVVDAGWSFQCHGELDDSGV